MVLSSRSRTPFAVAEPFVAGCQGYLKDVLMRLPTHRNSLIEELLPHRWTPLPR